MESKKKYTAREWSKRNMELKDPRSGEVAMVTNFNYYNVIYDRSTTESFNNKGSGKQDFTSANIHGNSKEPRLSDDEDSDRRRQIWDPNWSVVSTSKRESFNKKNLRRLSNKDDYALMDQIWDPNWSGKFVSKRDTSNNRSNIKQDFEDPFRSLDRIRRSRRYYSDDDSFFHSRERSDLSYYSLPRPLPRPPPPPRQSTTHCYHSDPYEEDSDYSEDENPYSRVKKYVHVYLENLRSTTRATIVQGIKQDYNYTRILDDLKMEFHCDGYIVCDADFGRVIQLYRDHVMDVCTYLVRIVRSREFIKKHRL